MNTVVVPAWVCPCHAPASRRGMAFVYAMIVMSVMLILGAVFLHVGLNSGKWAYGHVQGDRAFYLAEAAVNRSAWMMQASAAGTDNINAALRVTASEAAAGVTRTFESTTYALDAGSYSFRCVAPHKQIAGTVGIYATGVAADGTQEDIFTVVRAEAPPGAGTVTPPAAFFYAVFSDHNMQINGSPQIIGHTDQGGAGLYTNGNITFNGVAATVYGPLHAVGNIYGTCTQVPADAGVFPNSPRVTMPEIDLSWYRNNADVILGSGGNVNMNGHDASLGTPEDPKIVYVNGTVKLSGNLTGVGVLVASKGVDVTGNIYYGSPDSAWAILTPGNFKMTGTAQVHGAVYCHNAAGTAEFIGHGTPNVFGSVVADVITFTGDYTVEWDGGPSSIWDLPGTQFSDGPPVVDTLTWKRN